MTASGTTTPVSLDLRHQFRDLLPELGTDWVAATPPAPELVVLNDSLAGELGMDPTAVASAAGVGLLTGTAVPSTAKPIAMAYAGHQFGSYSPRLGDGRALLLGEVADAEGGLRDLHLKGSGRTPYARGGDGKAALGPMLREYLIAEAMHALGIPTGRALAVLTTGEEVMREGPLPGALLVRVASSHLRVGTFEYAARLGDVKVLRRLADHAITRHHPSAAAADRPYLALLESVIEVQASLVAQWMLVGFIHGVMNTDNVTISGETIDYGPCAFMDRYDPATVYSSIDRGGRYAYGNQPAIMQWNLARFAESLLPLLGEDMETAVQDATALLRTFPDRYGAQFNRGMAAKLGATSAGPGDAEHHAGLLAAMKAGSLDYTGTFRALAAGLRGDSHDLHGAIEGSAAMAAWRETWQNRITAAGEDRLAVAARMDAVNPVTIPRNHLVEGALGAATAGDLTPFHELLAQVTNPFTVGTDPAYARPAPTEFDDSFATFCGT